MTKVATSVDSEFFLPADAFFRANLSEEDIHPQIEVLRKYRLGPFRD